MKLRKEHNGWRLALEHAVVSMLKIDFRLSLVLGEAADAVELIVETPFHVVSSGVDILCIPEKPGTLSPILPLVNTTVNSLVITEAGHIFVEFDNGASLSIDPDPSYEAWQLAGTIGLLVCSPGGGVSQFETG